MSICPNCGSVAPQYAPPPPPPAPINTISNYLVPSIIVTLCCCVPFGIVAIVYAAQVNTKLAAGDVAGAQESSRLAKMWTWIAFGSGVLIAVIYAGLVGVGALAGRH